VGDTSDKPGRSDPVQRLKEAALAYADVEAESSEVSYNSAWTRLAHAAVAYAGKVERVYCDNGCGRWWYWSIGRGRPHRFCSVACGVQKRRKEKALTDAMR
jgi:hypothetical protein